jgi:hypothetical protein
MDQPIGEPVTTEYPAPPVVGQLPEEYRQTPPEDPPAIEAPAQRAKPPLHAGLAAKFRVGEKIPLKGFWFTLVDMQGLGLLWIIDDITSKEKKRLGIATPPISAAGLQEDK